MAEFVVAGGKNPPNLQPQMSLTVVGEKGLTGREKALIRYITQKTAQTNKIKSLCPNDGKKFTCSDCTHPVKSKRGCVLAQSSSTKTLSSYYSKFRNLE